MHEYIRNVKKETEKHNLALGTREALSSIKLQIKKYYDIVKHDLLISRLLETGRDTKDIKIIQELYWNQTAKIRINKDLFTYTFNVCKGVRECCTNAF